jgi:hypothetical protein
MRLLVFLLTAMFSTGIISGANLAISRSDPVPGPDDIYNFRGAVADVDNVNEGKSLRNGAANDEFTYISSDRKNQGQTFTTGTNAAGYMIEAVWVKQCGYTANTGGGSGDDNGTWIALAAGGSFAVRVTLPAKAGTKDFVIHSENCTVPDLSNEAYSATPAGSINGDGIWLKFVFTDPIRFDSPIVLLPRKTYGFDVGAFAPKDHFFEWLGTKRNVFSGGTAYQGGQAIESDGPDNVYKPLSGDRVFLVQLKAIKISAEPKTRE